MSAVLKYPPLEPELTYVYRPRPVLVPERKVLAELSVVALRVPATTFDGLAIPAGATGTVVTVWEDGAAYDVEFTDPAGLASLTADDLEIA
ncbi:DUF4926 domain-containing protein [uncultured Enterovirga sp.]|uniref:DUF4926 domain-containing protein n=1 Tax=uncultured Enterovirga sp. TaxID=2026352 RepID=UPI0035CA5F8C